MARIEFVKKERQAKKRKHEDAQSKKSNANATEEAGNDDEVANKVVVISAPQNDLEKEKHTNPKNKTNKRKQTDSEEAISKEKRSKPQAPKNDQKINESDDHDDLDDDEQEEPTAAQLQEAAKPENSNAIITVRQKKKQKHLQRLEAQKEQHADKDIKRNYEYLSKWKDSRQEWKFNKLRQISIQKLAFDEQKLSPGMWPIALEYLASSKGAAKAIIIKLAETVIQDVDKECDKSTEESVKQKFIDSPRYQRARDLLQSFD